MNKDDLEKKLENLSKRDLPPLQHHWQLKLAILSAKKSAWAALWLLLPAFLILSGALMESFLHLSIPPESWLKEYSPHWPAWLRMLIFLMTVIIFPLIAVLLNILSITWIQFDRSQKVLHISIRVRLVNILIIAIAGLLAILFIAHTIADFLAGAD